MIKKVALIVGHTREKQGAENNSTYKGLTEFKYNSELVNLIAHKLDMLNNYSEFERHIDLELYILFREKFIEDIIKKDNLLQPDLTIEFHLNAYNHSARGTEMLIKHNTKDNDFIQFVNDMGVAVSNAVQTRWRGVKSVKRKERGWKLLHKVKYPVLLAESFFIDNDDDMKHGYENMDLLADVYASYIFRYLRGENEK